MKKTVLVSFLLILLTAISIPTVAYANMAAPDLPDIGSTVTFEKNDSISVLSEVLDITVKGEFAQIVAKYTMKNTTDNTVTTPSMFISPNVSNVAVKMNGTPIDYTTKSYALDLAEDIVSTDGWKYVLVESDYSPDDRKVDTVTFELTFNGGQQCEVQVSYDYRLGGRPTRTDNVRYGEIKYLLTPASMWKDFTNITINLYLDDNLPVLSKSNLEFEKISKNHYQYTSTTLPSEDLEIQLDITGWQNFWGQFKNPYFYMAIVMMAPIWLPILLIVVIVVIVIVVKHRKKKQQQ